MMLKGQDASHIVWGNSFVEDGHQRARFDYSLANPPFGVESKMVADVVKAEPIVDLATRHVETSAVQIVAAMGSVGR